MSIASTLFCHGCGIEVSVDSPLPFRCPNAGSDDDIDHLLRRRLDADLLGSREARRAIFTGDAANPFLKYRSLLHSHLVGVSHGLDDSTFGDLVDTLDGAIADIDGHGFRTTPLLPAERLTESLGLAHGCLWVKNETGNVSGSHKARHLMGLALWLGVAERLWPDHLKGSPRLAIASCGNAALGAAVVARAAQRPLDVFVPPWADPNVVERLSALGARLVTCPREGSLPGDPCFHRFREATAGGALAFTCQGSENGLVIEGGKTLAWEIASQLLVQGRNLEHLFIQVGGGALASACIQGFQEAAALGSIARLPAFHTVQTAGGYPLHRAWELLVSWILDRHGGDSAEPRAGLRRDIERANFVRAEVSDELISEALAYAATHRSAFMWPWEQEPRSIATGILDDETYDWLTVVEGMLRTGGVPLVVSEDTLAHAHRLARELTGIPVDPTGSSGLAGLVAMNHVGALPQSATAAVLFTGIER